MMRDRLATSVRQVTRDQMEPGPTESDMGRSWFLLSPGCDGSRYYCVTHGTGQIPNETQFSCRTLVACLMRDDRRIADEYSYGCVRNSVRRRGIHLTGTHRRALHSGT